MFRYILYFQKKYLFIYSEFLNRRKIEKRVRVSEPCGDGDLPPMVDGGGKHRHRTAGHSQRENKSNIFYCALTNVFRFLSNDYEFMI